MGHYKFLGFYLLGGNWRFVPEQDVTGSLSPVPVDRRIGAIAGRARGYFAAVSRGESRHLG